MNLLQIALTTKCNLKCPTCPMAEYRTDEHPKYVITNVRLIAYLYKYIDPKEWFIELTGGEPGTYEDLPALLDWLQTHQYRGLIKTNGILPIPKFGHFPRIAAFHNLKMPPKYYDQILIVYGNDMNAKADWCNERDIPFQVIGFNKDAIDNTKHNIKRMSFIDAIGQVLACPACKPSPNITQYGDQSMIDFSEPRDHLACAHCKAIIDFWRFIEPAWRLL